MQSQSDVYCDDITIAFFIFISFTRRSIEYEYLSMSMHCGDQNRKWGEAAMNPEPNRHTSPTAETMRKSPSDRLNKVNKDQSDRLIARLITHFNYA